MTTKKIFDVLGISGAGTLSKITEDYLTTIDKSTPNISELNNKIYTKEELERFDEIKSIIDKYNKTLIINKSKGSKFNKDKFTIETFNRIKDLINV